MKTPSLSKLLKHLKFSDQAEPKNYQKDLDALQLKMLRIQQGLWHQKKRAIIVFEGFDAAGKGGAIRRLTEDLDPRSCVVYGISAPTANEQGRHYLYRFWRRLPLPGTMAIFDRSWYGRVLVERVEKLTEKKRWKQAYDEIPEFEAMLINDDVDLIKIFLAIDREEQLKRFEARLNDPYKQWKLTKDDVEARSKWKDYVAAADEMFEQTHSHKSPWHLVAANNKSEARLEVLQIVTERLKHHGRWMESKAHDNEVSSLKRSLKELGVDKI